ncbi:hypothetical protein [Paraburkholderia sp. J8-2]|uniref:TolB family protein n=1 Tax=Paraburkholderia sp. J8-2 TaxID=2805440 RepID=UPI002AB77F43|nr:hypothetical protein [Paraburkholderia sp. J8-2]
MNDSFDLSSAVSRTIRGAIVSALMASAVSAEAFPPIPEHHLPLIDVLSDKRPVVLETRRLWNEKPERLEFGVFDLASGKQSLWNLPPELLDEPSHNGRPRLLSPNRGEAAWANFSGVMLVAHSEAIYMVHPNGSYSKINLLMPGKLLQYDGMSHYALSPDASNVAYALYTRDRKDTQFAGSTGKLYTGLLIQQTEGSEPIEIAKDDIDFLPTFSPDGKKIAFKRGFDRLEVTDSMGHEIFMVETHIKAELWKNLVGITEIQWSPDNRRIGFIANNRLYTVEANGQNMAAMPGAFERLDIKNFAWSPDSTKIVFRSDFEAGKDCEFNLIYKFEVGEFPCWTTYYLYTINADGSGLKRVNSDREYRPGKLFWIPSH